LESVLVSRDAVSAEVVTGLDPISVALISISVDSVELPVFETDCT